MALDLTALTNWVDQNKMTLIKEAIVKGRTAQKIRVQPGIKNSATINRIKSDLIAQAGDCGWNATGSTILDQRTLTVDKIRINEPICLTKLEDIYQSVNMNPGSYNEGIPFEQIFSENKRDELQKLVEDLTWKGNKSTGTGNLALANGFIKLFDAGITASSDQYGTYTIASFSANAVDVVDQMVAKINENIIDSEDLTLFMSYANYRTYSKCLREKNLYAYTGAENQGDAFSQYHPGTNVLVYAVAGLNGTNRLVLAPSQTLVLGTDLLEDAESFELFYSMDNDEVRFRSKFKLGTEVDWLENVTYFKGV